MAKRGLPTARSGAIKGLVNKSDLIETPPKPVSKWEPKSADSKGQPAKSRKKSASPDPSPPAPTPKK